MTYKKKNAALLSYKMIKVAFGDGTQDKQLMDELYRGTPQIGGVGDYGKRRKEIL